MVSDASYSIRTRRPAEGIHARRRSLAPAENGWAALVLGRQASATLTTAQAAVFVAAVFAASASWQTLLAGGGALVGRLVTSRLGMLGPRWHQVS
ncbi:MAG TPA: hypothetical protein VEH31_07795 [Streptosporangiaceae bacterium]|nr:hypothetical protein [Streptosporangiaceae bacterium]